MKKLADQTPTIENVKEYYAAVPVDVYNDLVKTINFSNHDPVFLS